MEHCTGKHCSIKIERIFFHSVGLGTNHEMKNGANSEFRYIVNLVREAVYKNLTSARILVADFPIFYYCILFFVEVWMMHFFH